MQQPQIPPNRVPVEPLEQEQNLVNKRTHDISDFNWLSIIVIITVFIIIGIIAKVVITDGSTFISDIAHCFANIFDRSTLNPYDKNGFTSFVQLLLTAGFIGILLYFFRRK